MRCARFFARLVVRGGIIAVRSPSGACSTGMGGNSPVGAIKPGNISAPPGVVTQLCPAGVVQTTVPSGSWRSRQPQKVLSK